MMARNITARTTLWPTIVAAALLAPALVGAQETLGDLIRIAIEVLNAAVYLIMVIAILAFIYGAIKFIYTSGDDASRAQGKQLMIWGTLSLFVMVAVWGIVAIIARTFLGPA
jgi:hypothetical protein